MCGTHRVRDHDRAQALNAAIKASRHPVAVRVDGHGILSPDPIATAVRFLEQTGGQNVGGIMPAGGENDRGTRSPPR